MNVCETYDFIVIGGGSAGYAAARTANELGAKVAVVDDAEELGGLCILRGCMPSKTLIYSAEVLHLAQQGQVFGFKDQKTRADLAAMQQRKKEIIAEFADYRSGQLQDGRFSLYRSKAKFVDQNSIEFTDGKTIKGDRFVLATGSQIAMPPVPGLDQVSFKTSDEVLE
ncbi:MAG: FAD-dependent oxidoreductase, partial [Verrucomicrobiota bacterium]|nr:FAD-dependent oxidoreductase [Verrucomicrobiota bacterium]